MTGTHLLEVKDLTVEFLSFGGAFRATNGVSFHVDAGETLVILGESGSGKSVSASAIMGLIDTPPGDICAGSVTYRGRDLEGMSEEARRDLNGRKIAMIFQDPLSHLNPVYTIGWQLAEVFSAHGVATGAQAREKAIDILRRVGIPEPEKRIDQYPHQFSGGQRQRIMIGMAIALRPEILIADEPTTALDVSVQAQILDLLKKLQAEDGLAIIMITHDLEVAASMADRVIVMNSGRIVEEGEARAVFENPKHSYTRTLINALPHGDQDAPRRQAGKPVGKPILEVKSLDKFYTLSSGIFSAPVQLHAVKNLSFDVAPGETIGIVGESGSGKSTVARVLLRLNDASNGEALFHGRDILKMDGNALLSFRRKVQMVFQDPYSSMNPRMTVFEIVSEPWRIHKDILGKARWHDRVVELLGLVGLKPEHAARYPHQFSGGQRQRISIARALACEPELVVCDEAVSALDVSVQLQVINLLADLRDRLGLAYIFITHDLPIVRHFADRIIVMKNGEIVEHAMTEEIFRNPQHDYTRQLINATPKPKWQNAVDAA
ncbi:peptide/nickel transport system ATP-binding protein [Rhizobium tibeticum]|uniref:ABC transporter ATP-binding protein n=1 Tax=Rhizobium tibeticum TaxID=501024 RepID=UPI00277F5F7C|nr:ABC transporter ATP-binding protein [Rhizobium tibeticum]MDP9812212.1 peptide/nickel transport system ATP-binding protein [Rhizobium tibeticum]